MHSILKLSFRTISFTLILCLVIFSSEVWSQNGLRVFDEIGGGGGSTTTQSDDGNDDTALYVVGGLVVAGILVYALIINKDKKAPEDSAKTKESNLRLYEVNSLAYEQEIQKVKDKIPVDLIMGVRNNQAVLNDKTYLFGLRVKL